MKSAALSFLPLALLAASAAQSQPVSPNPWTSGGMRPPEVESGSDAGRRIGRDLLRPYNEGAVIIRRRCGPAVEGDPQSARPTGEIHAGASTAGEVIAGGEVCIPLKRGDIIIGGEYGKAELPIPVRRPGWPPSP